MCRQEKENGSVIKIEVNVTKIVKYVCMAGVLIVGIIFGCSAWADVNKD